MIYCVEDDEGIRNMMVYTLRASGMEALGLMDGTELFLALEKRRPELILLDIMLPGEDGLTILKRLREGRDTGDIPVIMASARDTEFDKVSGLDLGADDYLSKPFGMMEMVSRVKAVLRRTAPRAVAAALSFGPIRLDDGSRVATVEDQPLELTKKEYDLLRLFLENPGRVFTRDQLLERVWGIDFAGETRTVDVHIGMLRRALGPWGDWIKTIRGVGYRMDGEESR